MRKSMVTILGLLLLLAGVAVLWGQTAALIDEATQVKAPSVTSLVFRALDTAGRRELAPDATIAVNSAAGTFGVVFPPATSKTYVDSFPAVSPGPTVTLPSTPIGNDLFLVYRNGVLQREGIGAHFTRTGTTIQFAVPLKLGDEVRAVYYR